MPARNRALRWAERLSAIDRLDRTRTLRPLQMTGATTGLIDNQTVIIACSNDYLGLAHDPRVRAAAAGSGAAASRLISGSRPIHHELETELEELFGRPALLFSSGYQANLAVFSTVCEVGDLVASDEFNHASIIDGLRLSKARRQIVAHADPAAIAPSTRLIIVEGLYSMDGDIPPLAAYPVEPWLAVDEAHAVGCLGPNGRGAAAAAGRTPDILIGTFGKALGAAGAFVVGPPELKQLLVNAGRSFIYTTAPPEPVARMALAGLRIASREGHELRESLTANASYFRRALSTMGWEARGTEHIVPVIAGNQALELSAGLLARGVFVPAIRFPTVPRGLERLRFTVSAAHTRDQLDQVLEALGPRETPTGRML